MACVAMNDRLRNTTQKLMHHDSFVVLGHSIKGLLNDMASERIHAETQSIATDGISNSDDLLWGSMLEATLHQEVAEAVDHQRIGLGNNSFDYLILLLDGANFELLLQEDRGLLVIVANDLVDYVLPVAGDASIKQTTVVQGLHCGYISLSR